MTPSRHVIFIQVVTDAYPCWRHHKICPSVCLSIRLFVCLSCLSVHLPIGSSICLSFSLSICLVFVYLSVCVWVCLSVFLSLSLFISLICVCLFAYLSLFFCLSLCLSLCHFSILVVVSGCFSVCLAICFMSVILAPNATNVFLCPSNYKVVLVNYFYGSWKMQVVLKISNV